MADLHYRLTNEEWLSLNRELKPAELMILLHLRTLDPFGDRTLSIGVRKLAEELSCNPSTVSRALKVLDAKGYIEIDLVHVDIKVKSKGRCVETTPLPTDNTDDRYATPMIATQHPRSVDNTCTPEPPPSLESGSPHTIYTIHTNQTNKTLSPPPEDQPVESEREEKLIQFVINQNPEAKRPRAYAIRCLQIDRSHWEARYLSSQNGSVEAGNIPPPPPDRFQIESSCIVAHAHGNREFILAKLQQLWQQGWHDLIEDLCQLYPTWGIAATNSGVEAIGWQT